MLGQRLVIGGRYNPTGLSVGDHASEHVRGDCPFFATYGVQVLGEEKTESEAIIWAF